jgi:hypothetical protein
MVFGLEDEIAENNHWSRCSQIHHCTNWQSAWSTSLLEAFQVLPSA